MERPALSNFDHKSSHVLGIYEEYNWNVDDQWNLLIKDASHKKLAQKPNFPQFNFVTEAQKNLAAL